MVGQMTRRHFHNAYEWRRFTYLSLTVVSWCAFLLYMLLFHFQRGFFEPLIMHSLGIQHAINYTTVEESVFLLLLWSCCFASVISMVNTWGKKRRPGDNKPDQLLVVIMATTVSFAFYYAYHDLDCLNGQLLLLGNLFNAV